MCFSNLPVEFDEHGNPYLADEADDVDRPWVVPGDDPPLEESPQTAYAEIVNDLPENLRTSLADAHGGDGGDDTGHDGGDDTGHDAGDDSAVDAGHDDQRESARGD